MKSMEDIYDAIAKRHGIRAESVRRDIVHALKKGIKNPDDGIQTVWAEIPCKSKWPSPKEVICFCALKALANIPSEVF